MNWDYRIPLAGTFPVHWAVLRNDEGLVEVWQSPHRDLPPSADDEPHEERQGLTTYLVRPLSVYSDYELGIAAQTMAKLAWEDFLGACLINKVYLALREQREREGGYRPETVKPYDQEEEPEGSSGEGREA